MVKRSILFCYAIAIFPILALLAGNISEVNPRVAFRAIIITLVATTLLLLFLFIISRHWVNAALGTTLFIVLFFTYGHVYELLQKYPLFGFNLGRHRYLIFLYGLILLVGIWLIFFRLKNTQNVVQALNIVGVMLLIYPSYQIINHSLQTSLNERSIIETSPKMNEIDLRSVKTLPDVYFIVLDGYTRGDALLQDFHIDNSSFLQSLRDMGFYVADCSRANYVSTHESMVATLNMDYLPSIEKDLASQGLTAEEDLWLLIKQSRVRSLLESIGYKTVSFENGFEWSRLRDADVYLQYTGAPYEMQTMQPFEAMLIRSTALLIWSDSVYKSLPDYKHTFFGAANFPFEFHINQQLFILDQLPRLASSPGPKFVFAHTLITHFPFVFSATGDILTDPGFYGSDDHSPTDEQHYMDGYTHAVQFTNDKMVKILEAIITDSEPQPIIVVMSDHGFSKQNRLCTISAFYLPDDGEKLFYPSITSVNTFRLIFDRYFGTDYGLLPDFSYDEMGTPAPETYLDCAQP